LIMRVCPSPSAGSREAVGDLVVVGQYHSIGAWSTSFGTSIRVGPGRPVVAMWNDCRTAMAGPAPHHELVVL
jgi:hypothetical protein